jgi:hypothetical protein
LYDPDGLKIVYRYYLCKSRVKEYASIQFHLSAYTDAMLLCRGDHCVDQTEKKSGQKGYRTRARTEYKNVCKNLYRTIERMVLLHA